MTTADACAALYLVRHADAGDRTRFSGDDDLERPLSPRGREQSARIAERLGGVAFVRLLSSPAVRCVGTFEPLATARHLALEEVEALVEGADPHKALEVLLASGASASAPVAACSHGDVLGAILEDILRRGLPVEGKVRLPKAMTVEVALSAAGEPSHLRFVGPKGGSR
ncbi:MAG TPA: phosphoglycerate mutase family protein [Acidimicrobiales bacterium]|nr:phosphoglycerate mutase family protein [Acidimicrobiales bacterium]